MSFLKQIESDLTKVLSAEIGPGEDIIIQPFDSETSVKIRAYFDLSGVSVALGQGSGISSEAPILYLRESDFYKVLGRKITKRDYFSIRAVQYRMENPQPDGAGMVEIKLLEA